MNFYTAHYSYRGTDRLDITVKGKDPIGRVFAPTWDMVMGYKNKKIDWDEYSRQYRNLMRKTYKECRQVWESILARDEVTLVCFCRPDQNCHRFLLAGYFEKLGATYLGER